MTISGHVQDIFERLDSLVMACLQPKAAEWELAAVYAGFGKQLKQKVGTDSNFTGLSEYLFFRFLDPSIEDRVDLRFAAEAATRFTYQFRAGPLMMTHDVPSVTGGKGHG